MKLPTCQIHDIQIENLKLMDSYTSWNLLICDFPELHAEAIADSPDDANSMIKSWILNTKLMLQSSIFQILKQSTYHLYYTSSTKRNQKDPKGWCTLNVTSTTFKKTTRVTIFHLKKSSPGGKCHARQSVLKSILFRRWAAGVGGWWFDHMLENNRWKPLKCLRVFNWNFESFLQCQSDPPV